MTLIGSRMTGCRQLFGGGLYDQWLSTQV